MTTAMDKWPAAARLVAVAATGHLPTAPTPPQGTRLLPRHRRAGDGPPTGLAPASDRFFNEPGFGIMLREEFGLVLHNLRGMSFERFGDLRVQLLPGNA
jgi:hypothetical protein